MKRDWEEFYRRIGPIAGRVARSFGVDPDDLVQEVILEYRNKPVPDNDKFLGKRVQQVAAGLRDQERTQRGDDTYDMDEVKELLELGALWADVGPSKRVNQDLVAAFSRLTPLSREALESRYIEGIVPSAYREPTKYQRLSRAHISLLKWMNRIAESWSHVPDGLGSRRATSNARARYIVDSSWEN